jgi:hypothetical protein
MFIVQIIYTTLTHFSVTSVHTSHSCPGIAVCKLVAYTHHLRLGKQVIRLLKFGPNDANYTVIKKLLIESKRGVTPATLVTRVQSIRFGSD